MSLAKLKTLLLANGGNGFQRDEFLREEISSNEAAVLLKYGRLFDGRGARRIRMKANGCHDNSRELVMKHSGWQLWTGLALSKDGCWRVHSWAVDKQLRIVETTEPRMRYFGVPILT